jgi:hypothetical protein
MVLSPLEVTVRATIAVNLRPSVRLRAHFCLISPSVLAYFEFVLDVDPLPGPLPGAGETPHPSHRGAHTVTHSIVLSLPAN